MAGGGFFIIDEAPFKDPDEVVTSIFPNRYKSHAH